MRKWALDLAKERNGRITGKNREAALRFVSAVRDEDHYAYKAIAELA